jgi:hypothetical protein
MLATTFALLMLSPTLAAAGTVNLYWNDCVGNGGVTNEMFACGLNTGTHVAAGRSSYRRRFRISWAWSSP